MPIFRHNEQLFWPKFVQKGLGLEIQNSNTGIRISILEIPCVAIFRQNGQGLEIQKTNVGIRISIFEVLCVPIFRKNGQR